MDKRIDGQTDGKTDGLMHRKDRRIHGQTKPQFALVHTKCGFSPF